MADTDKKVQREAQELPGQRGSFVTTALQGPGARRGICGFPGDGSSGRSPVVRGPKVFQKKRRRARERRRELRREGSMRMPKQANPRQRQATAVGTGAHLRRTGRLRPGRLQSRGLVPELVIFRVPTHGVRVERGLGLGSWAVGRRGWNQGTGRRTPQKEARETGRPGDVCGGAPLARGRTATRAHRGRWAHRGNGGCRHAGQWGRCRAARPPVKRGKGWGEKKRAASAASEGERGNQGGRPRHGTLHARAVSGDGTAMAKGDGRAAATWHIARRWGAQ